MTDILKKFSDLYIEGANNIDWDLLCDKAEKLGIEPESEEYYDLMEKMYPERLMIECYATTSDNSRNFFQMYSMDFEQFCRYFDMIFERLSHYWDPKMLCNQNDPLKWFRENDIAFPKADEIALLEKYFRKWAKAMIASEVDDDVEEQLGLVRMDRDDDEMQYIDLISEIEEAKAEYGWDLDTEEVKELYGPFKNGVADLEKLYAETPNGFRLTIEKGPLTMKKADCDLKNAFKQHKDELLPDFEQIVKEVPVLPTIKIKAHVYYDEEEYASFEDEYTIADMFPECYFNTEVLNHCWDGYPFKDDSWFVQNGIEKPYDDILKKITEEFVKYVNYISAVNCIDYIYKKYDAVLEDGNVKELLGEKFSSDEFTEINKMICDTSLFESDFELINAVNSLKNF